MNKINAAELDLKQLDKYYLHLFKLAVDNRQTVLDSKIPVVGV